MFIQCWVFTCGYGLTSHVFSSFNQRHKILPSTQWSRWWWHLSWPSLTRRAKKHLRFRVRFQWFSFLFKDVLFGFYWFCVASLFPILGTEAELESLWQVLPKAKAVVDSIEVLDDEATTVFASHSEASDSPKTFGFGTSTCREKTQFLLWFIIIIIIFGKNMTILVPLGRAAALAVRPCHRRRGHLRINDEKRAGCIRNMNENARHSPKRSWNMGNIWTDGPVDFGLTYFQATGFLSSISTIQWAAVPLKLSF